MRIRVENNRIDIQHLDPDPTLEKKNPGSYNLDDIEDSCTGLRIRVEIKRSASDTREKKSDPDPTIEK